MLTVGEKFPEFKCKACVGLTGDDLTEINSGTDEGKWKVFVFYPKDFTFVCPTELVEFGKRLKDFQDRDAVVYGASTDNEHSHLAWRQQHEDLRDLPYPLLATQKLAQELDILEPDENVCLRATYIVDPEGTIQWVSVNSLSVGRSVDEVLRVLDAIQSDELCPCNWKQGDPYLQPA
ncbi:MAG: peroxiredoxin [Phycisphaeraceae bacterium]